MYSWWRDIIREGTFEGQHTFVVQKGLRMGMLLFIVSEIMFFFAFFWAFFDSSIKPAIAIGGVWPPNGLEILNPWGVPLLNTIILLSSGATVTWAHHAIVAGAKRSAVISLIITILLAAVFTALQVLEYVEAPFSISDGIYGSCFFYGNRFPRFSCIYWNRFFNCLFREITIKSFYKRASFWFRSSRLVLAFCRCCLVIFICYNLLVGFLIKLNYAIFIKSVRAISNFIYCANTSRNF